MDYELNVHLRELNFGGEDTNHSFQPLELNIIDYIYIRTLATTTIIIYNYDIEIYIFY